jgi:hypothetical protein
MDQTVKLWYGASGELRDIIVPGETSTSQGVGVSEGSGRISARDSSQRTQPTPGRESLPIDQYKRTVDQLLQTEMELIDAESRLRTKLAEAEAVNELRRRVEALKGAKTNLMKALDKNKFPAGQSKHDPVEKVP